MDLFSSIDSKQIIEKVEDAIESMDCRMTAALQRIEQRLVFMETVSANDVTIPYVAVSVSIMSFLSACREFSALSFIKIGELVVGELTRWRKISSTILHHQTLFASGTRV